MSAIAQDLNSPDLHVGVLRRWMPLLNREAVLSIVAWYAHQHGLTFFEGLSQLFSKGDEEWIKTCQSFGITHA